MNIFQYIQGIRTGKEANHTEYEAMKDPFLADALDGYTDTKGSHKRQIDKLQNSITKKCKKKSNYGLVGGIAAAVVVVIGIGVYFLVIEPDAANNLFASAGQKSPTKEKVQKQTQPVTKTQAEEIKPEPEVENKPEEKPVVTTPTTTPSQVIATNKPEVPVTDSKPQTAIPQASTVPTTTTAPNSTERPVTATQTTAVATERKEDSSTQVVSETPVTPTDVSANSQQTVTTLPSTEQPVQRETTQEAAKPKIKGKVTDKNGNALAGASVSVPGANKRTTTNASGYFELEAEDNSSILIRSLGYDPVILTGSPGQNLQISMEEVPKE